MQVFSGGPEALVDRKYPDGQRELWLNMKEEKYWGPDRNAWLWYPGGKTLAVGTEGAGHPQVERAAKVFGEVGLPSIEGVLAGEGSGAKPGVYLLSDRYPSFKSLDKEVQRALRRAFGNQPIYGETLDRSKTQAIRSGWELDTLRRQLTTLRYDPGQKRDYHGRWTKIGSTAVGALDDGAAADFLDERFADWGSSLGEMDLIGLKGWRRRGGAEHLNNMLRYPDANETDVMFQDFPKDEMGWWKGSMDRAIEAAPTVGADLDLHMFRGITNRHRIDGKVGDEFVDPGYVSTTTDIQVARDYAGAAGGHGLVMAITIPKEAKGAWLRANPNLNDTTHELVLPRGSRFRVVDNDPGPGIDRELRLVLPDQPPKKLASSTTFRSSDGPPKGGSIPELTAWAKKTYPDTVWDLRQGYAPSVEMALRGFHRVAQEWPSITVHKFSVLKMKNGGTYAQAGPGGIQLNSSWFGGDKETHFKLLRQAKADGRRPKSDEAIIRPLTTNEKRPWTVADDPEGLVIHEFGHLVDYRSSAAQGGSNQERASRRKAWQAMRGRAMIMPSLSRYGSSDGGEGMAEGFAAMYLLPRKDWNIFTRDLERTLMNLYPEWGGAPP
jgi:hypothetical protein